MLAIWSVFVGAAFWLLYTRVGAHPEWLFPMYALVGLGVGVTAMVPSIAVAAFPAPVRFSGLSFSYNVAYAVCKSEEHTSELQSLMRISYSVFCLKKKKEN